MNIQPRNSVVKGFEAEETNPALKSLIETTAVRRGHPSNIWMQTYDGSYAARPAYVAGKSWGRVLDMTAQEALSLIYDRCEVEAVWVDGLMLPPGIYIYNRMRILCARDIPWTDTQAVTPEEESDIVKRIDGNAWHRLVAGFEANAPRVHYWLAGFCDRIAEHRATGTITRALPVLCVPGAQGVGKTMLLKKLPALIGIEPLDIGRYLTGDTHFTPRINQSALLTADDTLGALSPAARREMGVRVKPILYGAGHEIHLKGMDPVTVRLPWGVVIMCNTDHESLRAIPLMQQGDEHKMLVVPMTREVPDNKTWEQKAEWDSALSNKKAIREYRIYLNKIAREARDGKGTAGVVDETGRQYVRGGIYDNRIALDLGVLSPAGVAEEAVMETLTNIIRKSMPEASLLGGWITTRDVIKLIHTSACNYNLQQQFDKIGDRTRQRDAVEAALKARNVESKVDSHLKDTVWLSVKSLVETTNNNN